MTLRVLCIDDDVRLFEVLAEYFAQNDVIAVHAANGQLGLDLLRGDAFDAVLLDVMMPGLDGLSVLRKVREQNAIPVLMLTAKGDETDRVVGLELGADDYLAKPFSPRELLARLRAVLRRGNHDLGSDRLVIRGVELDLGARQVRFRGEHVDLTALEFDLLAALMQRAGRVVPRTTLLELAGRHDVTVGERTVDVHVSRLRKKLFDEENLLIKTVRGVGYTLAREGG
ncbi:MAG: response regulator transcription factor [Polyangiaceae bacterium]|nr:response regulator transcription factor [Polyangiaceae bacterium]